MLLPALPRPVTVSPLPWSQRGGMMRWSKAGIGSAMHYSATASAWPPLTSRFARDSGVCVPRESPAEAPQECRRGFEK